MARAAAEKAAAEESRAKLCKRREQGGFARRPCSLEVLEVDSFGRVGYVDQLWTAHLPNTEKEFCHQKKNTNLYRKGGVCRIQSTLEAD